jgi:hypothetical protein
MVQQAARQPVSCQRSGGGLNGLLLSVAPGILSSLVADLRGVDPAVVGRVLAGPAGRSGVRRLPPSR